MKRWASQDANEPGAEGRLMRRLVGLAAAAALVLSVATTGLASADHTHVIHTGNGDCVVIAANGGEKNVEVGAGAFAHNPNILVAAPPKAHPIHVLVHNGVPGDHLTIEVLGLDSCGGFVNAD